MIKSDDIHCGVAATQKRIKLEAWWPGYSRDVEEYIKRCKKCKELRNFTQITLHSWPREVKKWNHRVVFKWIMHTLLEWDFY